MLGRQLQRRRNIVVNAPQLRHYLRELAYGIAEGGPELGRVAEPQGLLDHLDKRDIRRRALHLIAAAGAVKHTALPCLEDEFLRQPRLAHTGLAADEDDRTLADNRLLHESAQLRALFLATDVRRPFGEDRSCGGGGSFFRGPLDFVEAPALREALEAEAPPVEQLSIAAVAEDDFDRL